VWKSAPVYHSEKKKKGGVGKDVEKGEQKIELIIGGGGKTSLAIAKKKRSRRKKNADFLSRLSPGYHRSEKECEQLKGRKKSKKGSFSIDHGVDRRRQHHYRKKRGVHGLNDGGEEKERNLHLSAEKNEGAPFRRGKVVPSATTARKP